MIYLNPNLRASYRDGYVIASFICDTAAELPALNYIADYTLEIGSTAHVIENATDYEMMSDGRWKVARTSDLQTLVTSISNLESEMTGVHSDIDILVNQVGELRAAAVRLVDNGAKNIMPIGNAVTSETKRGITATYDFSAGTVTLNGTHDGTGDAVFYLYIGAAADQKVIPAGSYHLSGCPTGGSTETYCLIVQNVGGSPAYKLDTGSGQDFTITGDGRMAPIIRVKKPEDQTVSFDNAVFRPMITTADFWKISENFVPYAPTNAELYALIKSYHP